MVQPLLCAQVYQLHYIVHVHTTKMIKHKLHVAHDGFLYWPTFYTRGNVMNQCPSKCVLGTM